MIGCGPIRQLLLRHADNLRRDADFMTQLAEQLGAPPEGGARKTPKAAPPRDQSLVPISAVIAPPAKKPKAAPVPRPAAKVIDPLLAPGARVLEELERAGAPGLAPSELRERVGLDPHRLKLLLAPMLDQRLVERRALDGTVRIHLAARGHDELARLRGGNGTPRKETST